MMQINDTPQTEFKVTEIGRIPVDWDCVQLSSISKVISGQSPPSSTYNDEGVGLPFFQGKAEFGLRHPNVTKWCSTPERISEIGDILISVRAPVGDVNITPYKCCIGRGLAAIRANEKGNYLFIYYLLIYAKERLESEGTGSTFKSINRSILTNFPIPLPPLTEQRRIAAVLNAIQDEIAVQDDILRELREFKRSTMERLFTYGAGATPAETKMTNVGDIPVHWDVAELGEIAVISTGTTPSTKRSDYYEGSNPFIKTAEVTNQRITTAMSFVSDQAVNDYNLKKYPIGTTLMAMYGQGKTRGQVALLEIVASTTQNAAAIVPSKSVNAEYLWQYLLSQYERLRQTGVDGHISHLNLSYVKSLLLPLPSSPEQVNIASHLNSIDEKIDAEEDLKAALQDFFRTMLQQLMTGQIRLLSDDGLENI